MSMERKRYTEPQIVFALQQAEAEIGGEGLTLDVREAGVFVAAF